MDEIDLNNLKELKKIIDKQLDDDSKEEALALLKDFEIKYTRLTKSSNMQIEELEMEKEILLKNFIRKDEELNEAYKKLRSKKERNIIYRVIRKIRNARKKDVK